MNVLAFDTATSACSAAVRRDARTVARLFAPMARGQSEALMPMIVQAMTEAGVVFADLDLIGVTVGPGAFTGLRIGLAAARGIALAAERPVAGVLTTEVLAHGASAEERAGRTVMAVVDAKRADVFVQCFDEALRPLAPVRALLPEEIPTLAPGPLLLVGDGIERVLPHLPDAVAATASTAPDAAVVAALAEAKWAAGEALPPTPVYLRPPDVTLPGPPR